jgi:hypothetical protein
VEPIVPVATKSVVVHRKAGEHVVNRAAEPDRVAAGRRHRDRLAASVRRFEIPDDAPDWPTVSIRIDGKNPFARVAEDIAEQLLSVAPEDWLGRFGHALRTWGRTASAAGGP